MRASESGTSSISERLVGLDVPLGGPSTIFDGASELAIVSALEAVESARVRRVSPSSECDVRGGSWLTVNRSADGIRVAGCDSVCPGENGVFWSSVWIAICGVGCRCDESAEDSSLGLAMSDGQPGSY